MKAMKSMNMNRMLGSLKRKPNSNGDNASTDSHLDTPEANAARNVRLFCESGGPNGSGEEVLYLPAIVESCESSPAAAERAAYVIRKYLSKDNSSKPYVQYNGIMLIRILADNPGRTFTRNMDAKFVQTVKELLRVGRDPSVKQILMETLDTFQRTKADDEGLALLNEMWKKEQEKMAKQQGQPGPRVMNAPPFDNNSQNYFSRNHHSRSLPAPHELSSRIEEARTSAGLLSQVVQSTPPSEILTNELLREFADRCQSASRSIQAYMIAENPSPDNDTMETLIETNEQLTSAINKHQRAILSARKAAGLGNGSPSSTPPPGRTDSGFAAPPGPPPNRTQSGFAPPPGPPPTQTRPTRKPAPQIPPPGDYAPTGLDEEDENPFSDPRENGKKIPPFPEDKPPAATGQFNDRLGIEPYHPGFKETKSYVNRQDSSTGNVTMHAAVELETPVEQRPDPASRIGGYGTKSGNEAPIYRY
ncbi:hypothetical protein L207DRAFT_571652 [Hyaloscypha variabilis F]|uniref:GAT domain-containing protein n=1 Tax=Hyaloscypha variabilis (strain UAMH 11265 / GT02V1 / F) TaxID=1149755 RepID=A0A2J6R4U1_HYAVF|nr:hypothetical protein L207DRAFT_571652 [Hyaloscypha variabilis F]